MLVDFLSFFFTFFSQIYLVALDMPPSPRDPPIRQSLPFVVSLLALELQVR
jgi:hypothetical protein